LRNCLNATKLKEIKSMRFIRTETGIHVAVDKVASFLPRWNKETKKYGVTIWSQGADDPWHATLHADELSSLQAEPETVVRAEPGYELLCIIDDDETFDFLRVPIIAWRIGEHETKPVTISISGFKRTAVLCPGGMVEETGLLCSFDRWVEVAREQHEARRKSKRTKAAE
jgi:hypothetical protein